MWEMVVLFRLNGLQFYDIYATFATGEVAEKCGSNLMSLWSRIFLSTVVRLVEVLKCVFRVITLIQD